MTRAFTKFYSEHGADLVSREYQHAADLFRSRETLFLSLGIPPSFVEGRSILEFGPGTGHYSLFNLSLAPKTYEFVEGVKAVAAELQERLEGVNNCEVNWQIHEQYFEEFDGTDQYDVVVAESCIPHQENPRALFRHMIRFVKPGGVFVMTTASGASYLSETLRRLIRDKLIDPSEKIEKQLEVMVPIYAEHLHHLDGVSRSAYDWTLDNVIQPLGRVKLFSIPDAVDALSEEYSVLGTSPRMIEDWTWHRTLLDPAKHSRSNAKRSYFANIGNIIDCKSTGVRVAPEVGELLESRCDQLWSAMGELEIDSHIGWSTVIKHLEGIHEIVISSGFSTKDAIAEVLEFFSSDSPNTRRLEHFPRWWGVGQQHMAFCRRRYL